MMMMMMTCHDSAIGQTIEHPDFAAGVFMPMMLPHRETLVAMYLDENRKIITALVIAVGTVDSVDCDPLAVFTPALALNAHAVLIAHNHPSGNPTPSIPDIQTTKFIEGLAKHLGILFVDHLVLTTSGRYRSIAEYMERF